MCLDRKGAAGASVEADFDALKAAAGLEIDEPAFICFARSEGSRRGWQLVCWVPDSAPPRLKMLRAPESSAGAESCLGGRRGLVTVPREGESRPRRPPRTAAGTRPRART